MAYFSFPVTLSPVMTAWEKSSCFFVKSLVFLNTTERVSSKIGKPFPSTLQLKLFLEALCTRISRLLFWTPMVLIKTGLHHGYKFWVQHDVCVFSVQKVEVVPALNHFIMNKILDLWLESSIVCRISKLIFSCHKHHRGSGHTLHVTQRSGCLGTETMA